MEQIAQKCRHGSISVLFAPFSLDFRAEPMLGRFAALGTHEELLVSFPQAGVAQ